MHFKKLKWPEVKALDFARLIAIAPLGSIEQHSLHRPLSVDTDIITELSERVEAAQARDDCLIANALAGTFNAPPLFGVAKPGDSALYGSHQRAVRFIDSYGLSQDSVSQRSRRQRDRDQSRDAECED